MTIRFNFESSLKLSNAIIIRCKRNDYYLTNLKKQDDPRFPEQYESER